MANRFSTLLTVATAATLLMAGVADAQTARRVTSVRTQTVRTHRPVIVAEISDRTARPLTIQKRSFLDPGNVVPVGAETPANIVFNTTEHVPVYRSFDRAFFGESALPGRFDLPPTNPRFNVSAQPHIPLPFE